MDKDDAIEYLEGKDKIREMPEGPDFSKEEEGFYDKDEKAEIQKVMREGKIYGDPLVELS